MKVIVQDSGGGNIESQILPISNSTMKIRNFYAKAYVNKFPKDTLKFWLAFSVIVPPLGFSTYFVSLAEQTGFIVFLFCTTVKDSCDVINT